MRILLLFLFLAYPMLELALMIKVGSAIGVWPLFGIIMITGVLGVLAMRQHGLTILRRMTESVTEGRPMVASAFDSALVCTAGVMLIAPGLITDAIGLLLLAPPLRRLIIRWSSRYFFFDTASPFSKPDMQNAGPAAADPVAEASNPRDSDAFGRPRRERREPIIIEGEFERIDERTVDPKKGRQPSNDP